MKNKKAPHVLLALQCVQSIEPAIDSIAKNKDVDSLYAITEDASSTIFMKDSCFYASFLLKYFSN